MEAPRRKRNRLTIVCLRCRVKKSKCDRKLPCSQCVKAKCPDLCVYGEDKHVAEDQLLHHSIEQHLSALRGAHFVPLQTALLLPDFVLEEHSLVGVNPVVPSLDKMNFHMDLTGGLAKYRGVKYALRPFPFVKLLQQDVGGRLFWKYEDFAHKLKLKVRQAVPEAVGAEAVAGAQRLFGDKFIPDLDNVCVAKGECRAVLDRYCAPLGLACGPELGSNLEATAALLFPPRDAVLGLCRRFFAKLYPLFPIVDETWVYAQLDRLVRYTPAGPEAVVQLRDDRCVLALLLVVLRMAHQLLFAAVPAPAEPDAWLQKHPVPMAAAECAAALVQSAQRHRPSFAVLQALLLVFVCMLLAPDAALVWVGPDSVFSMGALVLVATLLLLDRDPDVCWDNSLDEKARNLRRKVWFVLVRLDAQLCALFLCPRLVHPHLYDTAVPSYTAYNLNIVNEQLERAVVAALAHAHAAYAGAGALVDVCLDLAHTTPVARVVALVTELEVAVQRDLGCPADYCQPLPEPAPLRLLRLHTLATLRVFAATVYYFLHLYYRHKGLELEYFFFRKVMTVVYREMHCFSVELLFCAPALYDRLFFLVMTPMLLVHAHLVAILGLGLAIRLNCSQMLESRSAPAAPTHSPRSALLRHLAAKNEAYVLRKLKLVKVLSERSFYAWKCTKTNGYGYAMLFNTQLYSANLAALQRAAVLWLERQQYELTRLIPEDVPVRGADPETVRRHCYSSAKSIDDAELRGTDLYKTVQTDNMWLLFNVMVDRDPLANVTKGENDQLPYFSRAKLPVFRPKDVLDQVPEVDFNLFSMDWTIEDFFPHAQ